jgi:hypothetical protein
MKINYFQKIFMISLLATLEKAPMIAEIVPSDYEIHFIKNWYLTIKQQPCV